MVEHSQRKESYVENIDAIEVENIDAFMGTHCRYKVGIIGVQIYLGEFSCELSCLTNPSRFLWNRVESCFPAPDPLLFHQINACRQPCGMLALFGLRPLVAGLVALELSQLGLVSGWGTHPLET